MTSRMILSSLLLVIRSLCDMNARDSPLSSGPSCGVCLRPRCFNTHHSARPKAVSDHVSPVLPVVHATFDFVKLFEKRAPYSFVKYVPFNQRVGGEKSGS